MAEATKERGIWSGKLAFILAAAGSAVGLGNIWRFPTEAASHGGGVFLLIYLVFAFLIGYPVMMAEMSIGRNSRKNPVGAFKFLASDNKLYMLIGAWGVLCGIMILSYYTVVAGWTFSYVFEELFHFMGMAELSNWFGDTSHGINNALFSVLFMSATIAIITGGVAEGIEKATKTLMPLLILILIILIGYVLTQEGSAKGLSRYLTPDLTKINAEVIFAAMGQAFFSLSLGMGAIITYGSYLPKRENIAGAAAYVTLFDTGIAFLAGLLIIPAMFVAQSNGITIFEGGGLKAGPALIFQVLPNMFHNIGGMWGMVFGVGFFLLLSIAALTSTISLLEVVTAYAIDEHGVQRKKAAMGVGSGILLVSLFISFDISLIGTLDLIFSSIGLPLGGFLICLFVGYKWGPQDAMAELEVGYDQFEKSIVRKAWPVFIKVLAPLAILYNLVSTLFGTF